MTPIGFLHLEIFCFDPKADYEFYFKKYKISYTHAKPSGEQISTSQTLGEILALISSALDISVDISVGLKINGIALLGDDISNELDYKAGQKTKEILSKETSSKETLGALLERFGNDWRIEPLSTRYVKKDLTIDVQAMHAKYEGFFDKHSFITSKEREYLSKYLPLNLISTRDDDYLGDGFFLFVKWLAQRHSKHLEYLLESISDTKNGVLSYSSIQNLLYKPNPQIDIDIEWLINALLAQKKYKEISQALVKKPKISIKDFASLASSKSIDFANFAKKYILFDGYDNRDSKESSEIIASCQKLCEKLEIQLASKANNPSKEEVNISFAYNGGHFARIGDFGSFLECTLSNILQASARGYTLLFGDYASFCEARLALQALSSAKSKTPCTLDFTNEVKNLIESIQNNEAINRLLSQDSIAYIGDLLRERLHDFSRSDESGTLSGSALSIVSFISNTTSALESSLDEMSYIERIQGIFDALNQGSKKIILKSFIAQDFSHLAHLNEQCYLEESAKIRFAGIDEGADLLLVDSVLQFRAFDTQAKSSAKAYGRDMDSTKAVFLPSLILLVLEEILGADKIAQSKQESKAV